MYIAVQHKISDPSTFWKIAGEAIPNLPPNLKLHHCLPVRDGSRGICVWEGESIDAVREYLEGALGHVSTNEYFEVENKDAIGVPSGLQAA